METTEPSPLWSFFAQVIDQPNKTVLYLMSEFVFWDSWRIKEPGKSDQER